MGQLVSTKKRFRGDYTPLANDDDEFLETPAESCAFALAEGSLRRASSDDICVVPNGRTHSTDHALESCRKSSTSPLSVVTTATGKRNSKLSSTAGSVPADREFHATKLPLEPGRGTLVRVTECTNCGNTCFDSIPPKPLQRSKSMQW